MPYTVYRSLKILLTRTVHCAAKSCSKHLQIMWARARLKEDEEEKHCVALYPSTAEVALPDDFKGKNFTQFPLITKDSSPLQIQYIERVKTD